MNRRGLKTIHGQNQHRKPTTTGNLTTTRKRHIEIPNRQEGPLTNCTKTGQQAVRFWVSETVLTKRHDGNQTINNSLRATYVRACDDYAHDIYAHACMIDDACNALMHVRRSLTACACDALNSSRNHQCALCGRGNISLCVAPSLHGRINLFLNLIIRI